MKIDCYCGETISDVTDYLPSKGWLTPDEDWNDVFDALDGRVIRPLAAGALSVDDAYVMSRDLVSGPQRPMWQCRSCGRLYIDDEHGKLHCYVPNDDQVSKTILNGRRPANEA